jgi:hypothetical protein
MHGSGESTLLIIARKLTAYLTGLRLAHVQSGSETTGFARLILIFDEAHTLTHTDTGIGRSRFHTLGHVLGWLQDCPIFSIFMSTNDKVRDFAPPAGKHPSWRGGRLFRLLPPLTEFVSTDIHAEGLHTALEDLNRLNLAAVCSPDIVTRMGRPQ